jgi:hypothetical protein
MQKQLHNSIESQKLNYDLYLNIIFQLNTYHARKKINTKNSN